MHMFKIIKYFFLDLYPFGKPQKKFFFSGPATKALTPPPSNLKAIDTFF